MTSFQVDAIRRRIEHSISPQVADQAGDGMTVENIKQFIAFQFTPSEVQLSRLACYLGVQL